MPLYNKLAASANVHPADVTMVKGALRRLGFYQAPDWGIDELPDRALFDAIEAFQKANGLKADGVIDPGGKTEEMLLGPVARHTNAPTSVRPNNAARNVSCRHSIRD